MPDYTVHDPKGWCGDPKRGAAMGRYDYLPDDPEEYTGKLYLRRVRMIEQGDYDYLGTYWGANIDNIGDIYWCASEDLEVDFCVRAQNREHAKLHVLDKLPNARFFR